tara:strand:- start:615 stop:1601 length:987 start_codon:yes stop_codon:yes gene_type:complete
MADYRTIQGAAVRSRANNTGLVAGQIWYDTTADKFKYEAFLSSGTWSTSGSLNAGRYALGNMGIPSAGHAIDGNTHPVGAPNTASNSHESYDGSTWTSLSNTPFAVTFFASSGVDTAGIGAGGGQPAGSYQSSAYTWGGSSWTSITSVPGGGFEAANMFGTQTANIFYGGGTPAGYPSAAFTGDGSSWTSGPNLPGSNYYGCVCTGTQTAAISIGGASPTTNKVEILSGSTWTSSTAVPITVPNGSGNGVGTSTAAVYGQATTVLSWDGSSWSTEASFPVGKPSRAATGGTVSGWFAAGGTPGGTPTPSARETSEFATGAVTRTISTT